MKTHNEFKLADGSIYLALILKPNKDHIWLDMPKPVKREIRMRSK